MSLQDEKEKMRQDMKVEQHQKELNKLAEQKIIDEQIEKGKK